MSVNTFDHTRLLETLFEMASSSSANPFVVHTTPPFARLPASDVESIYLSAVFQLAAPGRFALQTADWGDNGGSLPYVTHLDHRIRRHHLASIPAYQDPDEDLEAGQKAEVLSWTAYIEQNLTDIVVSPTHLCTSVTVGIVAYFQSQTSHNLTQFGEVSVYPTGCLLSRCFTLEVPLPG